MKVTVSGENYVTVELTRRNLVALLEKLDDPKSVRTLQKYSDDDARLSVLVKAVEDEEHYFDRMPGAIYMPSSGETR